MKRVMAVDYGDARTGIAISDLLCSITGSTTVIHSRDQDKTLEKIGELVRANDVDRIVVGLPKNMDGSEGPRAALCRAFAARPGIFSCCPQNAAGRFPCSGFA